MASDEKTTSPKIKRECKHGSEETTIVQNDQPVNGLGDPGASDNPPGSQTSIGSHDRGNNNGDENDKSSLKGSKTSLNSHGLKGSTASLKLPNASAANLKSPSPENSSTNLQSSSPAPNIDNQKPESKEDSVINLKSPSREGSLASIKSSSQANPQSTSPKGSATDLKDTSPKSSATNLKSPSPRGSTSNLKSPSPKESVTNLKSPSPKGSATNLKSPSPKGSVTNLKSPSPKGSVTNLKSPSPNGSVTNLKSPSPNGSVTNLKSPSPNGSVTNLKSPKGSVENLRSPSPGAKESEHDRSTPNDQGSRRSSLGSRSSIQRDIGPRSRTSVHSKASDITNSRTSMRSHDSEYNSDMNAQGNRESSQGDNPDVDLDLAGERHEQQDQPDDYQETAQQQQDESDDRMLLEQADVELQTDLDKIKNKSLPIEHRLDTVNSLLAYEKDKINDCHFKDYKRMETLQCILDAGHTMVDDYQATLTGYYNQLEEYRTSLSGLSTTIDKKLTNEGSTSWMNGPRAHPADTAAVATEKQTIADAAEARSRAAQAQKSILQCEARIAELETEAADTLQDAKVATREAEQAAKLVLEEQKAAEEKRQAEEEAKRRAEEERKRQGEEERKKREEEERRRQEEARLAGSPEELERRRKEAERKDPQNWPQYVYSIEPGEINIPIACVIRAMSGTMDREDLSAENLPQTTCPVSLDLNEELASHIIKVTSLKDFKISEPLSVALAHVAPRNAPSREIIIKRLGVNGKWSELDTKDVHFEDIKDYRFVEVRLHNASATLAVVTRPKRETLTITKRGGKVLPSVDPRICFAFRQGTFKTPTNMKVEIQPVDLTTVSDLKYRKPTECHNLLASSPFIHFTLLGSNLPKPITINVPVPPNPNKQRRPQTSVGGADRDKSGAKSGPGRPMTAIMASYKKEEEAEDDLYLLVRSETDGWSVKSDVDLVQSKGKDIVSMELTAPLNKFVIVRTAPSTSRGDVESLIQTLDDAIKERVVQVLLRQKSDDPHTVTLQCVPILRAERYQRKLAEDGYEHGPSPSDDLVLHEGQKMVIQFRGNIRDTDDNGNGGTALDFVFNTHIMTKVDFKVDIIDKFAQKSLDTFRGFAQVFAEEPLPKQSGAETERVNAWVSKSQKKANKMEGYTLLCELLINLQKPAPESPKPVVNRTPVRFKPEDILDNDYLKHLSSVIGEEWKMIAQQLGVRRVRLQAIMRNNITRDNEAIIYEMLATWAKRIPRYTNKVEVLCTVLTNVGRSDLVEEIRDKECDLHQERLQAAREPYLRKAYVRIAQSLPIMNEWQRLGKGLGLKGTDLDDIDSKHPGIRDKVVTCLKTWQNSDPKTDVVMLLRILRRCRWGRLASEIQTALGLN